MQSRQKLQTALDRRFFREAYEQEQVLVHLIDEVRRQDSLADVARLVSQRVSMRCSIPHRCTSSTARRSVAIVSTVSLRPASLLVRS